MYYILFKKLHIATILTLGFSIMFMMVMKITNFFCSVPSAPRRTYTHITGIVKILCSYFWISLMYAATYVISVFANYVHILCCQAWSDIYYCFFFPSSMKRIRIKFTSIWEQKKYNFPQIKLPITRIFLFFVQSLYKANMI